MCHTKCQSIGLIYAKYIATALLGDVDRRNRLCVKISVTSDTCLRKLFSNIIAFLFFFKAWYCQLQKLSFDIKDVANQTHQKMFM